LIAVVIVFILAPDAPALKVHTASLRRTGQVVDLKQKWGIFGHKTVKMAQKWAKNSLFFMPLSGRYTPVSYSLRDSYTHK
jgi:hypothetical protein